MSPASLWSGYPFKPLDQASKEPVCRYNPNAFYKAVDIPFFNDLVAKRNVQLLFEVKQMWRHIGIIHLGFHCKPGFFGYGYEKVDFLF